jgi:hypothetical protein
LLGPHPVPDQPALDVGAPSIASPLGSPQRPEGEFTKELLHGHIHELRVSEVTGVAAPLDRDQRLAVGQLGAEPPRQLDVDRGVSRAVDHQRRRLDLAKPIVDIVAADQCLERLA